MLRSWKLGTAFGIGIYVHWTFFLLLVFIFSTASRSGMPVAVFSVAVVLAVFTCVVMHEYGHALTARYFGIETRDITILPIGGVARLERMSENPWEEMCIAVAGPAVNVVIASLLGVLLLFLRLPWESVPEGLKSPFELIPVFGVLGTFCFVLLCSNAVLVVFNMAPAFPMDGGRVFRALLSYQVGQLQATRVAVGVGGVFAALMAAYGISLFFKDPAEQNILPLVALFVVFAGLQELASVRNRHALRAARIVNGLPVPSVYLQESAYPPEPNFSGFTWDRQYHLWIEWREGRAVHACGVPSE